MLNSGLLSSNGLPDEVCGDVKTMRYILRVIARSLGGFVIFVAVGSAAIATCMIAVFLVSLVSGPDEVYQPLADTRNAGEVVDQFLIALVRNDFDAAKSVVAADQLPGLRVWMSTRTGFRYCEQSWKFSPVQGISLTKESSPTGIGKSYHCRSYRFTVDGIQLGRVRDRYTVESWAIPIEILR